MWTSPLTLVYNWQTDSFILPFWRFCRVYLYPLFIYWMNASVTYLIFNKDLQVFIEY